MTKGAIDNATQQTAALKRTETLWLLFIAVAVGMVHLLTNSRYGFHRDELQFLSDARHLDWGFVAYPPFTPVVERAALDVFGLSLVGLRLFSVIAQSAAILLTGLMAAELGGGRGPKSRRLWRLRFRRYPFSRGQNFNTPASTISGGC